MSYDRDDFIERIIAAYEYIMSADDAGSVDFEAGRLQIYFREMEDIFDENGGI